MKKSRKSLNLEDIQEIFSKETTADLEGVKKIFSRPDSLRETRKLWTGKAR